MKLLYVIHQYFPECFSGTEQYCLAASREARRRGDEVVVLSYETLDPPGPPLQVNDRPYDGFRVLRLHHAPALQPDAVLRDYENPHAATLFRQVLENERPDAVHFFHLRRLGSDFLEVARDAGVRTAVHLMDFWFLCPRFTLLRADGTLCDGPPDGGLGCIPCAHPELDGAPEERVQVLTRRLGAQMRRLALADAIFAPSRFLAALFEKNGLPPDRMTVVPYGLEPGRVERREVARPRLPLQLAFAGVLSPWKAPHIAVEAVKRVHGPVRLTVHGRTEEPTFADYIRELLGRADGDPRIRFPGPFEHAELSRVMAETDLLVVPSTWYENTPFVILEAFEAGVGVLASDLGGMTEVVEEGVNGYRFEAGDADALAERIRECLADPGRVARLRPRPAATIADNYDCFVEAYRG